MLEFLQPPLTLDGLLQLLTALILLSILVALLQSDSTIGAVRRAVNNITALPLLLILDLISGFEMVLTSERAQSIFANIQNTIFSIAEYLRKTIENANFSARTHKVFLTTLEYVDTAQLLAGRIKRVFTIFQALLIIVLEAAIDHIHVLRAGRSISEDVLSICDFIIHAGIRIITLLYVVSKGLYNLISTIMIKLHRRLRKSAVYTTSSDLILGIPAIVSDKLGSFWMSVCNGLNQKLTAVLELIFGDGYMMESPTLDSSAHISSISTDVVPASNSNYQSPWKGRLRARTSDAVRRQ